MQVELCEGGATVAQLNVSKVWRLGALLQELHGRSNAEGSVSEPIRAQLAALPQPPPHGVLLPLDERGRWRDGVLIWPGALVKFWTGEPEQYAADQPSAIGRFAYAVPLPDGYYDFFIEFDGQVLRAYKAELAFDPHCFPWKQAKAAQLARLLAAAEAHPSAEWRVAKLGKAPRRACKYFASDKGCRLGSACRFAHGDK